MNKVPVTAEGIKKLRDELEKLKHEDRPNVIQAIASARELGDLKENAEYHAARERQGFIEGRISDLEAKISNAQVIDVTKINNDGKVVFGSTVTLVNVETNEESTYKVVGDDEADYKENKLSINSPVARAIIGRFIDDVVEVKTPAGIVEYEISDVKYI